MGSAVNVVAGEQRKAFVQHEGIAEKQKPKLLLDRRWAQQGGKFDFYLFHVKFKRDDVVEGKNWKHSWTDIFAEIRKVEVGVSNLHSHILYERLKKLKFFKMLIKLFIRILNVSLKS